MPDTSKIRRSTTGFAFSGGGSRAACQVGMLRALTEHGIVPDFVAGTSAGAVTAAYFALYPQNLKRLEEIWLALRTQDIFPGSRLTVLSNLVRHGHIHVADRCERFFRAHFGSARFEDLRIPCSVVAVDLVEGKAVCVDSGEIVPALMASIAIPGVFPPYRHAGREYVDGGVLEHLPLSPFSNRRVSIVYAFDCSSVSAVSVSGLGVLDRTARIAARAQADATVSALSVQGAQVHLFRPSLPELQDARSFKQTAELMRIGYECACSELSAATPQTAAGA